MQAIRLATRAVIAASTSLAMLAGCAVGPDFRPAANSNSLPHQLTAHALPEATVAAPVAAGAAQHLRTAASIPAEWWALYQSPALDELMRKAIAASPTLAAARATLRQAQEDVNAGYGVLYPSVNLDASALRQRTTLTQTGTPAPRSTLFSLFNASVSVSYALDIFGGARRALEGLQSQVDYQQFQLEGAYLALTANIVTTAVREAALRRRLATTADIIADEERQLAVVERQFEVGAVPRTDLLAQRTQLAQMQATLPPLQLQLAQTEHQLAVLTGAFPQAPGLPEFDFDTLHLPEDLPLSLPSALARQRPDIRAAEALLHQASAAVGVATANLYPQISLSAGFGTQANQRENLFTSPSHIWNMSASLLQPLFNGGALQAKHRAAIAGFEQAEAQYRAVVLQAFQNVADTLRALEVDARTLQALAQAEAMAQASQQLAEVQFKHGAVSYLSLLNAQRQYLQARIAVIDAQAARLADTAALFQALGGGWWNRADSTAN